MLKSCERVRREGKDHKLADSIQPPEINHEVTRVEKQLSARERNYLVPFLHRQQDNIFF